jgi:hypothetical protein
MSNIQWRSIGEAVGGGPCEWVDAEINGWSISVRPWPLGDGWMFHAERVAAAYAVRERLDSTVPTTRARAMLIAEALCKSDES